MPSTSAGPWDTLHAMLPPTPHKAMVRALGWYAAQRGTDHVLEEQRCP
ncbi:hypothetical protein [Streptomyces sp. DH10]|nr:hypothetical protein [Streptomyces sp. DH10]MDG9711406.1 hypothetical protein [Streptomyces sp. DH10]